MKKHKWIKWLFVTLIANCVMAMLGFHLHAICGLLIVITILLAGILLALLEG